MKKQITLFLLSVLILLFFTSCSGASAGGGLLSPEELEKSHLEMELTEGVFVDAEVTPYSKYQNGLNAYYVSMLPQEADLVTGEAFMAEPSVYGYSPEELAQFMAEQSGFSPEYTWDMTAAPGRLRGDLAMRDQMGVMRTLSCYWLTDETGRVDTSPNALYYDYEQDAFDHNAACNLLSVTVPNGSELDFSSSEELAAKAEKILETLTDEVFYSEIICVPMGEANRQQLRDRGYELEGDLSVSRTPYLEEDYYGYLFYRDVDGFPLKYLCPAITLTENVTWDQELEVQMRQGLLIPLVADKQFVSWGRDSGLRYLSTDRKSHITGIYKEQVPVCDINTILEHARQYFDSMLIIDAVTVNHIEIAYSYWFSDAEDGPLQNIAAPFWTVQYWNPASEFQMLLVFDAFSGQLVGEKTYTP